MNLKELLTKLPNNWNEINVKQFQELTTANITNNQDGFDGVENSLEIISKFTQTPVDVLEQMPMKDISSLANKLEFMLVPPAPAKETLLKWKTIEQITFNDYVSFLQVSENPLQNISMVVKNFTISELNKEDIEALPITEIVTGFFLFNKGVKKYLKRSIRLTRMKAIKLTIQEKLKGWQQKMKK